MQGHETEEMVVVALMGDAGVGTTHAPVLRRVGCPVGLAFWRADFPGPPSLEDGPSGAVWVPAAQALQRDVWAAGHFDCLSPLGLTELAEGGLILPATLCVLLEAAGSVDEPSDMVLALQEATSGDVFLSEVLKSVQDSEEASWRDFFYDDQWRLLFYQRVGDATPRICVPSGCRAAVLREAHGGSVKAGHPEIARTTAHVARFLACTPIY